MTTKYTHEDLAKDIKKAKLGRIRIVEVREIRLVIVFVRPKKKEKTAALLNSVIPDGGSFVVASLGFWECIFRRRVYHIT